MSAFRQLQTGASTGDGIKLRLVEVIVIPDDPQNPLARPRSSIGASAASSLHLVSAWAADQRLVLGQIAADDKSNEITAVPKLLELLSLTGCIVTADAMSCQRKIARQVIDQRGDYVLIGQHPTEVIEHEFAP